MWTAIILFVCLIYVALRFWNLTDSCLWFDEIFSVHAAEHDWSGLFSFVAEDLIHPPLFYVLLKIWIAAGGESLFWLRFFSVFFSVLSLIPFYLFCRQLKLNFQIICLAFAFFAVNGALIKYAQEVRMYSLLLCFSLFSMWLFARYFNLGKNYTILIIVNILLVYTHYFGWFVVLSEVILIAVLQNIKIRQILIMLGAAILSYAPWIYMIWQAGGNNADVAQNIGWMSRPGFEAIFQFAFDVIEPFYYQQSSAEYASRYLITTPLLLVIVTAKIFYLKDWKNEAEKNAFYLLAVFIAVPVLIALIVSWLSPVSIWGTRHLIIVFVPLLILTAKFLAEVKSQILKIILLALVFLFFVFAFILQLKNQHPKFIWCGWENLTRTINAGEPQKIYVFEDLAAYHIWFALRDTDNVQIIKVNDVEGVTEDKAYFLPRGFDGVKTIDENKIEGERFWIAFKARNMNEIAPLMVNFSEKGYEFSEPQVFEAEGFKALLVEAKKK